MTLDIPFLIDEMTLEEKATLCTGASAWSTTAVERLGMPAMIVSDGPHGVRRMADLHSIAGAPSLPATCFPSGAASASTWDAELICRMGVALGQEGRALNVDVLLGPGVNIKRSPLGGRNFEFFSEDPYLAGELAASLIDGIQSTGVGAALKHFAVNSQEYQRFSISAELDERTLREIYLSAFEKAVKQAQPWIVMCSYNKVNGVYASEHHRLLTEILRDEWGFAGAVVSDWGAVRNRVAALKAGLDLEMPGPQDRRVKAVAEAVRSGDLDSTLLDASVRRILQTVAKAQATPKGGDFDADAHHELARRVAAEGMVLLKNDGILPLKGQQQIAVIGRSAVDAHYQGGGSSHVNPTRVVAPFDELPARAPTARFTYAEGYPVDDSFRQELIDQAVAAAQAADVALLFVALPAFKESEGYDRQDLDLTDHQVALIQAVSRAQPHTVVILNNGAPIAMNDWIDGVAAVLEAWMMGQAGGAAVADIVFGLANPCGKLAETFPLRLSDTPAFINWPGENGAVRYGEGLFVGYRYYDVRKLPVLFPFGFGLSYTTFAYSNPRVSAPRFQDRDGLTLTVDVTNTGACAGKEVVQVYVHDQKCTLARPEKELKAFAKVELQPGETKSVVLKLDFRAFAFYHPEHRQWVTEDGEFDLLIGASAADIRCREPVTLVSTLALPCILDTESTLREWLADPRGRQVLSPLYGQIETQARRAFGGGNGRSEATNHSVIGLDIMESMLDIPLTSVLMFQQSALTLPAEEIVAGLLRQVHSMESQ